MVNLVQTVEEIKSLKIQGATKVAKAGLKALLEIPDEWLGKAINELIAARPTEPLLQNCLNLIKLQGKEMIGPMLDKLDELGKLVTENGAGLIKDDMAILTHCHSSTVVNLLIKVSRLRQGYGGQRKIKVYLTETRPLMQGRITAEELVRAGINATMITDSEAAFLVSKEDKRKIDLVLLGADAILANGSIINKVGSYGIALAAQKAKTPVYVLANLLKFSAGRVTIEERGTGEVWKNKPHGLAIFNPAFDKIPPEFVTGIVCEFGVIKPEKVTAVVKKNYPWITNPSFWGRSQRRPTPESKTDSGQARMTKQAWNDKMSPYKSYLHLNEKINPENHLIADFLLTTEGGGDFYETAGGVGAESSVGTWTEVTTQFKKTWEELHARIIEADEKSGMVKIAYPLELFEPGNLPQLLSSVAGNIFGLKEINNLKLLDLELPEKYVVSFPGPAFGIDGIRKITGVYDRPLVGSIIKPKLGLTYKEHAAVAKAVYEGGLDFVKDDENLTSQSFNPFEKRVIEVLSNVSNLPNWQKKIYAFNVTAETETMLKRTKFIKDNGGNCLMIDFLTAGFSGLQSLRKANYGLIIHGHRAMHAALTRDLNEGISMLVLAKLGRLAGLDSLHTGTVIGKMEGGQERVTETNKFLLDEWYGLKPVLPVASGGLYPGLVPDLIRILGKDILLNFGGGIHGHPHGSKAGAMAVRQAVEAVRQGQTLEEYAKNHQELKMAIEHWRD